MSNEGVHRQLADAVVALRAHVVCQEFDCRRLRSQRSMWCPACDALADAEAALAAYEALRCTCGSGGHPRDCAMHPDRRQMHCQEIDLLNAYDRIKGLREAMKAHGQHCPQDNDLTSALAEDDGGLDV